MERFACGNDFGCYHFYGDLMYFRRIRDLRNDRDMTQKEVAELLHMQLSVYRRYELGEREIPVWAVILLAEYYGTSTDYLLGLTGETGRTE